MKLKELAGLISVVFLIVFFGSVFSAYIVISLPMMGGGLSLGLGALFTFFILALLTSMCFLLLYSRTMLSSRQIAIRYTIGTSMAVMIAYIIISRRGWVERSGQELLLTFIIVIAVFLHVAAVLTLSVKRRNSNAKIEVMEQERELYYTQQKLMHHSLEQQKSIRHDIKLHLAMIKKYLLIGQEGEAVKYLEEILKELEVKDYIESKNIAFDSIVNYKLSEAGKDVEIETNVVLPQEIQMDVMDIVIIMGNLLENALEAVEKVTEKKIKLEILFDRGNLFINIRNTFDGKVKLDKRPAEENRIVSRKGSRNHGYGLKNVEKSVGKYNGKLEISYDNQFFNVNVLACLPQRSGEKKADLLKD